MSRIHISATARRAHRVRRKLGKGAPDCPRVSVFRSNTALTAQAIDDSMGRTLCAVRTEKGKPYTMETCAEAGKRIASALKDAGVERILFDRGAYRYHGKVKAFADGMREGGVQF